DSASFATPSGPSALNGGSFACGTMDLMRGRDPLSNLGQGISPPVLDPGFAIGDPGNNWDWGPNVWTMGSAPLGCGTMDLMRGRDPLSNLGQGISPPVLDPGFAIGDPGNNWDWGPNVWTLGSAPFGCGTMDLMRGRDPFSNLGQSISQPVIDIN